MTGCCPDVQRPCRQRTPQARHPGRRPGQYGNTQRFSEIKLLFTQGPSITARVVVFVLASVILMTLDHRQNHLDGLRAGLSVALYPIQFLIDLPATAGSWLQDTFATRRTLQEENARLHAQHLLLEARLLKFEALEAENLRLR